MAILTDSYVTDLFALLVTVVAVVYAYFKWTYQYWKRRNVPYLEPQIPFGNLPNPFTGTLSAGENIEMLYNQAKAKGWKQCGVFAGVLPSLLVLDLDLLKNVMAKDFVHFTDRGMYTNEKDDPIGCHLVSLGGPKWKNLRAKLTPRFTSGKIKMMFQTVVNCGMVLERFIEEDVADKDVVDIKDLLGRFTTDIIGSCAFGLDCNSFKEPNSPFRVYGKKALEDSPLDLLKKAFTLNFPNASRVLGIRLFSKDVEDFYTKVVSDAISYREKNNVTCNDFLQLLMAMRKEDSNEVMGDGNTLTVQEIVAQCFLFFIAGFETSSTTMTFALFELSRHPEMQDKVREEIRTVLARHDNKITYDSMNELVYMKQVIDETLRMYPAFPLLNRECMVDYKVPGEDIMVEKGTIILIPIRGIHYDEDLFDKPKTFNPERFTAENKKNRHQYAYLPFGGGPRICIGERFGMMQTKVGLTSILRNFKVFLNAKTKLPFKMDPKSLITAAVGGIWLNIHKI